MPNLWTHLIFAEQVADKTGVDITEYKNAYFFGAQGPDLFFYHNFWPWKSDKSVTRIGSRIHQEKCEEFIIEMLQYLKQNQHSIIKYYVLGFVAHHLLDRNTHPYIIYKSGEADNKHQQLETTIDTILVKRFYGIDTWKGPIHEKINLGKNLPNEIIKLLAYLLREIHRVDSPNLEGVINQSYQEMIIALKIFYDPTGMKNRLLGKIIAPYSHRANYPKRDYLNEEHKEWADPTDQGAKSRESFLEIFARAEAECATIFQAIIAYINDDAEIDKIKELLGDISYETGKPCNLQLETQYFNPII